jgi:hypothetical protein
MASAMNRAIGDTDNRTPECTTGPLGPGSKIGETIFKQRLMG